MSTDENVEVVKEENVLEEYEDDPIPEGRQSRIEERFGENMGSYVTSYTYSSKREDDKPIAMTLGDFTRFLFHLINYDDVPTDTKIYFDTGKEIKDVLGIMQTILMEKDADIKDGAETIIVLQ